MVAECSTCGQVMERHGVAPEPRCPECGHTVPAKPAPACEAPPPDVHWAIKAQCAHCVDSYPQRQDKDDYIANFGDAMAGEWFHHGMVHSSSGVVECAAKYIHEALRALAASVPPPTGGK